MNAQTLGFWFLALVSVVSALHGGPAPQPGAVRAVPDRQLLLPGDLLPVLDAQVLAALQILVYAGAIMVLFLFVIMLLNLGGEQVQHDPLVAQRPLGVLFGAGLLYFLFSALSRSTALPTSPAGDTLTGLQADPVFQIGQLLFTKYVYPFEVTSLLLLVGIVGTILLAKRRVGTVGGGDGY